MPDIRILFFASLADHFGHQPVAFSPPPGMTAEALRAHLARERPAAAAGLAGARIAVNRNFAAESVVLKPGDEVAFIPPVSGG